MGVEGPIGITVSYNQWPLAVLQLKILYNKKDVCKLQVNGGSFFFGMFDPQMFCAFLLINLWATSISMLS